jgi:hypothetical protein
MLQSGSALPDRPQMLAELGLSEGMLEELIGKRLYTAGVQTLAELSTACALPGAVLEPLVAGLRREALVELRQSDGAGFRYLLTDRGRAWAADAIAKSGYVGPAPVPLEQYARVVEAQSVRGLHVRREAMQSAYHDAVLPAEMLEALGPALHSGRAIFLYGPPGSGKTYVGSRLPRLLTDSVLVPYAIAVGTNIIQFFDPVVHRPVEPDADPSRAARLDGQHDPRYVRCRRPAAITGGELTLDMLDLAYDPVEKLYTAPLHLKANNGLYMIDDLGRQRMRPEELLNRWIVPMEEHRDFLTLGGGRHFPVPFDVVLVFSTNLNPLELADQAFLRRLGYKIRFRHLERAEYGEIWRRVCAERGIRCDGRTLRHVLDLHEEQSVSRLPCHPRDLIGLMSDHCCYHDLPLVLTPALADIAWNNYFVDLGTG